MMFSLLFRRGYQLQDGELAVVVCILFGMAVSGTRFLMPLVFNVKGVLLQQEGRLHSAPGCSRLGYIVAVLVLSAAMASEREGVCC